MFEIPIPYYGWMLSTLLGVQMALFLFRLNATSRWWLTILCVKGFLALVHCVFAAVYENAEIDPSWYLFWLASMPWQDLFMMGAVFVFPRFALFPPRSACGRCRDQLA